MSDIYIFRKRPKEKDAIANAIFPNGNKKNNTLSVNLYTLAWPRMNKTLNEVCHLLNETETTFPGTNLVVCYKLKTL